jgi:hypothetical protein
MGHTRSNSSTGGTTRTTTRRLAVAPFRRTLPFVFAMIGLITMHRLESACQPEPGIVAEIVGTLAEINGP